MEKNYEERLMFVNLLLASQSVINSMDYLKDNKSKLYIHDLKKSGNNFQEVLHKHLSKNINNILLSEDSSVALDLIDVIETLAGLIIDGNKQGIVTFNRLARKGEKLDNFVLIDKIRLEELENIEKLSK